MDKQTHWLYLFIIFMLLTEVFPALNKVIDFFNFFIILIMIPIGIIYMLWYEKVYKSRNDATRK